MKTDVVHIRGEHGCGKQNRPGARLIGAVNSVVPHKVLKWDWHEDLCEACATKALPAFNAFVNARKSLDASSFEVWLKTVKTIERPVETPAPEQVDMFKDDDHER